MPNWVQTHIKVNGEKEKVEKILDSILSIDENEEKIFDLNKIIPMPEEIKNTDANGIKNSELLEKYGANSWYDWSIKNWGTKWNTCNSYFDEEENIISFQTAWSFPEPILQHLIKFENVSFEILYADEDRGSNLDIILINNGTITRFDIERKIGIKKRKEIAQMIWYCELDDAIDLATTIIKEKKKKRIEKYISD